MLENTVNLQEEENSVFCFSNLFDHISSHLQKVPFRGAHFGKAFIYELSHLTNIDFISSLP